MNTKYNENDDPRELLIDELIERSMEELSLTIDTIKKMEILAREYQKNAPLPKKLIEELNNIK